MHVYRFAIGMADNTPPRTYAIELAAHLKRVGLSCSIAYGYGSTPEWGFEEACFLTVCCSQANYYANLLGAIRRWLQVKGQLSALMTTDGARPQLVHAKPVPAEVTDL